MTDFANLLIEGINAFMEDDGYREWSETIELEAQRQQDEVAVIGEHYVMEWDEVRTIERESLERPCTLQEDYRMADPDDFQVIDLSNKSWPDILASMK